MIFIVFLVQYIRVLNNVQGCFQSRRFLLFSFRQCTQFGLVYTFSSHAKKVKRRKQKLEQTRITLDEVKRTLVADLKRLNEEDYERLDIEMELNKLEQERRKDV